jgi:hypothetical protein
MDIKLQIAESSKTGPVKKWLEDYRREQAMQYDLQLEAGTQEQAMSHTVARGPWKRGHQETSDTNKCPCFQSTLDTHGNFDRCDEARAKTITAAITVFLVGCTIPFSMVESSFFLKMIESLNNEYLCHLPKDDAFRHTHLLTLFNDTVPIPRLIKQRLFSIYSFPSLQNFQFQVMRYKIGFSVQQELGWQSKNETCTFIYLHDISLVSADFHGPSII